MLWASAKVVLGSKPSPEPPHNLPCTRHLSFVSPHPLSSPPCAGLHRSRQWPLWPSGLEKHEQETGGREQGRKENREFGVQNPQASSPAGSLHTGCGPGRGSQLLSCLSSHTALTSGFQHCSLLLPLQAQGWWRYLAVTSCMALRYPWSFLNILLTPLTTGPIFRLSSKSPYLNKPSVAGTLFKPCPSLTLEMRQFILGCPSSWLREATQQTFAKFALLGIHLFVLVVRVLNIYLQNFLIVTFFCKTFVFI